MSIKGLIFDLDGVLVDTKIIHFDALNFALKTLNIEQISFKDHLNIYDGLPTIEKLKILNKKKKLKKKYFKKIINLKQNKTKFFLNKHLKFNNKIYKTFNKLSKKYKICIATNAINQTLEICIRKLKLKRFIFKSFSNTDVFNNKPHPEVYLRCLVDMGLKPNETLIFEDSSHGVLAAQESGCHLFTVKNLSDITYSRIINFMKNIETDQQKKKIKLLVRSKLKYFNSNGWSWN